MEEQIEAVLTGTDSTIDGTLTVIKYGTAAKIYDFKSLDETLHLVIAKDIDGQWIRLTGTEPYLSGWIDELAGQTINL